MKIKVSVKKLPKTKEDKDNYHVKMETYKETIEGNFEKSEIRHLIEVLDNGIYQ